MRVHGNGPLYRKHGRHVRYHLADLVAWSEAGKRKSTSHVLQSGTASRRETVLAIVSIALVATIAVPPRPWLIYSASGSAHLGFHGVENRTPFRRDMVVVRPSAALENLLASHGLLPRDLPLLKRVIAVGGDQICRSAGVVFVNRMVAAEALDHGS
jgi:type IV secretory pathway protease TraF